LVEHLKVTVVTFESSEMAREWAGNRRRLRPVLRNCPALISSAVTGVLPAPVTHRKPLSNAYASLRPHGGLVFPIVRDQITVADLALLKIEPSVNELNTSILDIKMWHRSYVMNS
jgi:hypothetical protein